MHLSTVPIVLVLLGLVMYTVLGGADFGAGVWQLTAGRGPNSDRIRDHCHHAMAPVWEANHVWLIFVLVVMWTAYPVAFGSLASTLVVALFIAALGIIFRGVTYALRTGVSSARERRILDTTFALSSVLTPFALGAAVGGIASRRVPVGNAAGHLVSSWLNPTSILVGVLAVVTGAYLAAVYLAGDATRLGERDLAAEFRLRALIAGVLAAVIAFGGLVVLHSDAYPIYHGLLEGDGLPALIVSVVAGAATLGLVWAWRFEPARFGAALAVAAIVAGWALAQKPVLLPGLTIEQAAAPHDTLVAVVVSVLAGAVIIFPSLALLFRLVLTGGFDRPRPVAAPARAEGAIPFAATPGLVPRLAIACLIGGFGFLTIAEARWAHALGVALLFGFMLLGFVWIVPAALVESPSER